MKTKLRIFAIVAGLATSSGAEPIEYWNFNEQPRADLELIENSGMMGSIWNWATMGSMETDGDGHFIIKGDSGSLTRKLPKAGSASALVDRDIYATPLAGDSTYSLKVNFSGWNMAETPAGDSLIFKATDTNGAMIASISIKRMANNRVQIQLASAGSNYRGTPYPLKSGPVSLEIRFNFSTDTAEYYIDGVQTEQFDNFSPNALGSLILLTDGAWNRSEAWIKLDSMGLGIHDPSALPSAQLNLENKYTKIISKTFSSAPLASFDVQKGDVVLVLVSANKNTEHGGESITFKGTASVGKLVFEKTISKGPSTYAWHATADTKGSIEVNLSKSGDALWTTGLYHLRSSSGSIEQIGIAHGTGQLEATASYTFPSPFSGLYFESCSTYNSGGATAKNSGTTIDLANNDVRRNVAHGAFTQKGSLDNTWKSQPGDRPITLLGIAFGCAPNP